MAEAANVLFAARGDFPEMTEHVSGESREALVAGEGLVGDTSVDQIGWDAVGAGLGEMLGPELAFDEDDGVRTDATPREGAAGPEVGGEDADTVRDVGVAIPGQTETRAGGGRQDDFSLTGGLKLAE